MLNQNILNEFFRVHNHLKKWNTKVELWRDIGDCAVRLSEYRVFVNKITTVSDDYGNTTRNIELKFADNKIDIYECPINWQYWKTIEENKIYYVIGSIATIYCLVDKSSFEAFGPETHFSNVSICSDCKELITYEEGKLSKFEISKFKEPLWFEPDICLQDKGEFTNYYCKTENRYFFKRMA